MPPDQRWDDPQLRREWRAIVEPEHLRGINEAAARRQIEEKIAQIASFTVRQRRSPAFHTASCEAIFAISRLQLVLMERDRSLVALTALSLRFAGRMSDGDVARMAEELVQYQTFMIWRWQRYQRYVDQVDFSRDEQCSVERATRERIEQQRLRSETPTPTGLVPQQ